MTLAWPRSLSAHLRHHERFYKALALGVLVWVVIGQAMPSWHPAIAGNTFFGVYLAFMAGLVRRATPSDLRRRAASADEGILLIILITLAAIILSLGSIFALLNAPGSPDGLQLMLSLASVPLGWVTLHTVMAIHYAHLFYGPHASDRAAVAGGLQFPDTPEPDLWDFLYYAFVVGMTAQVSDVQVVGGQMRRVTLVHGVVSFFFNTVILALAVNVAVGVAH